MLQHALTNLDIGLRLTLCYLIINSATTRACISTHVRIVSDGCAIGHCFESVRRNVQIHKIIRCLFNETAVYRIVINLLLDFLYLRIRKLGRFGSRLENVHRSHYVVVAYRRVVYVVIPIVAGNTFDPCVLNICSLCHRTVEECDIVACLDSGILVHSKLLIQFAGKVEVLNRYHCFALNVSCTCYGNNVGNKQNLLGIGNSVLIDIISFIAGYGKILNRTVIGVKVTLGGDIALIDSNSVTRLEGCALVCEVTYVTAVNRCAAVADGNKTVGSICRQGNFVSRNINQAVRKSEV